MKSSNKTLVGALRELARVIQAPDDVPSLALLESADRIQTMHDFIFDVLADKISGPLGDENPELIKLIDEFASNNNLFGR
jgi:hypothetical protein